MQRIDGQSEEDRRIAHSAIIWVANAKRPLNVEEIRTALAVEPDARQLNKDNLMDIELIVAACAGLIILDVQRSVVRLVHSTTQEYLDSIQAEQFPDAQTDITRTLLTLLAFDGFPDSSWSDWDIDLPPLIDYSQYCLVHAAGKPEGPLRNMIVEFLGRAPRWKQTMWTWDTPPWGFTDWSSQSSALWVAAAANLVGTVKSLLEEAPMNKHPDGSGISIASHYGHLQMVQLLVENDADVNTPTEQHGPPLTAASEAGHNRIVRFLLKNGADVNAQGGRHGFALHAALARKKEKITLFLIKNGADVNLQGKYGGALTTASWYGMENIIVLLLGRGADMNARGGRYHFALHTALANKREKIARLLIENGADVNLQGEHGAALATASWYGMVNIVLLLLDRGADVNACGGQYSCALNTALAHKREKIARILIENGANVNVLGENLCCPLGLAADWGDEDLVQLLIDTGADPNVHGGMALLRASRDGHENAVRLHQENLTLLGCTP
ncbi:ankyrin repeat-containing domain protein [Mycena galopus ATCC 62051]|nr:ankyrin repeat-containing domain protein [Mycena galopus ATCC 62051]